MPCVLSAQHAPDIGEEKTAPRCVCTHKDVVLHNHVSRAVEETAPVLDTLTTIPLAMYRSKAWVWVVDDIAVDQPVRTERRAVASKQLSRTQISD